MSEIETAIERLARLRDPFPPEQVGLLPRVTCRDCSKNQCQNQNHRKAKCPDCSAYISSAHIHLDYVGHGAVTDRLLAVDPTWNWEPVRFDQDGMPAFVYDRSNNPIEFWIRLTVLGHTRLGVGTCPPGQFDASKVLIGDALRNAAMRFGVALDLWIKGHAEDDERTTATTDRRGPDRSAKDPLKDTEPAASKEQLAEIERLSAPLVGERLDRVVAWAKEQKLPEHLSAVQAQAAIDFMTPIAAEVDDEPGALTEFDHKAEAIAAAAEEVTS